jgi:hypothetical protein
MVYTNNRIFIDASDDRDGGEEESGIGRGAHDDGSRETVNGACGPETKIDAMAGHRFCLVCRADDAALTNHRDAGDLISLGAARHLCDCRRAQTAGRTLHRAATLIACDTAAGDANSRQTLPCQCHACVEHSRPRATWKQTAKSQREYGDRQ